MSWSFESPLDFNDYLVGAPVVPPGLPQGVSSFLTRVIIHEPTISSSAIITQAMEPSQPSSPIQIILDIDAFRQESFPTADPAGQQLEGLRDFKNQIFFES